MLAYLYLVHSRLGRRVTLTALLLQLIGPAGLAAQTATGCTATTGNAAELLHRAALSAGIAQGRAPLGLTLNEMVTQDYQSDRSYPPYSFDGRTTELWYYPDRAVERYSGQGLGPFGTQPLPPIWSTV